MIKWIAGGFLGVIIVITLGIFLAEILKKPPGTATTREKKKKWWEENIFYTALLFPIFHILGFAVWPHWWIDHMVLNWQVVVIQLLVLLPFALMIPTGGVPLHHRFGKKGVKLAAWGIVLVVFVNPFADWVMAKIHEGEVRSAQASRLVINNKVARSMQYGAQKPFVFDGGIPKCADLRVWTAAHAALQDNPFLLAVTARESGFRMYESKSKSDCTPDEGHFLLADLGEGRGKGTATGPLQIKPENHQEFCKEKGADMYNMFGHFHCAILINDDPSRGPESWDPEDGRPLSFPIEAKPGQDFSTPWKISYTARFRIISDGDVEIRFGLDDGKTLIIKMGASGLVYDQMGNVINPDLGNIVRTISYRSLGDSTVIGHVTLYYPVLSAKK